MRNQLETRKRKNSDEGAVKLSPIQNKIMVKKRKSRNTRGNKR